MDVFFKDDRNGTGWLDGEGIVIDDVEEDADTD